MDWDHLRFVLALHRRGSFTAAAAELGVTHTTVGRRLRALEDQLGVRLFDRTPDGVTATPEGEDLVEVARGVEAELLAAERRLAGRDAALSGPLRVTLFDFLLWGCADAIADFVSLHPDIDLTLNANLDEVSLPRREADVAIRLTETPPETLLGRRIGALGFAPYASAALVEQAGADAGYDAFPWIAMDTRTEGAAHFDGWLNANAPNARIAARIDESAVLRRTAVQSGIGAHFLPTWEGDALPGVQRIGPVTFTRGLWLLSHPAMRGNQRVRAFKTHMATALTRLTAD